MAKDKKHIITIPATITIAELIDYAEGRMSSHEEHLVEKYLLEHPFEAEALEGILLMEKPALATVYAQKIEEALFPKEKNRSVIWWWAVAASFLLLVGLFFFPSNPTARMTSSKVVEPNIPQAVDTIVQYSDTTALAYHENVQKNKIVENIASSPLQKSQDIKEKYTIEGEEILVTDELQDKAVAYHVTEDIADRTAKVSSFQEKQLIEDEQKDVTVEVLSSEKSNEQRSVDYDSLINEMLVMIDIGMQETVLYNTKVIEVMEDHSQNEAKEITDVVPNTIPKKEEPFITQQPHTIKENNKRLTFAKKAKSKAKKSVSKSRRKLGSSSKAKPLPPQKDMVSEEIALYDIESTISKKAEVPLQDSIVQKEVSADELVLKEESVQKSNDFQFEAVRKLIENKKYDEAMRNLAVMNQEEEKTRWLKAITHFGKGEAEDGVKQLLYIIQADQDTPITKKAREILRKLK